MNDLMLIKNVLYGLYECNTPTFVLKSDVQEVLNAGGPIMEYPKPQKAMHFNGKYYAYYRVKQKENEHTVCETSDGNTGQ